MKHVVFVLICIFLFGISTFFRKLAIDRMHPLQLQMIQGIVYAIMLPIWFLILSKNNVKFPPTQGIVYALIYTTIYITSATVFNYLIKDTNIGAISALTSLSPAVTIILSFLFLGEQLTVAKIIAFVLALMSAILINF